MSQTFKRQYRGTTLKELKKANKFYVPHVNAINSLNNIFFVTELSRDAISQIRDNLKDENEPNIDIDFPNMHGELITTTKKRSKTRKVLKNAIRYDLYSNSLISAVAATEGYLEQVVEICLLKDPRRLAHPIKKQGKKKGLTEPEIEVKIDDSSIPLRALLDADSLESMYSNVVSDRLLQLMYASPSDYFGYLKNALGIELPEDIKEEYIEIKATRDLLTHSQGFVNDIYIHKAGNRVRVKKTNQRIPLPPEYFKESIGAMKKLTGEIYREASREYFGITKSGELYPRRRS